MSLRDFEPYSAFFALLKKLAIKKSLKHVKALGILMTAVPNDEWSVASKVK
jgi:hypothetical protein